MPQTKHTQFSLDAPEREWPYNTQSESYAYQLFGRVPYNKGCQLTPSSRVVLALQKVNPQIKTKGFRKSVLDAIMMDGIGIDYEDDEYPERLVQRLIRRFGKMKARNILIEKFDILQTWRYRDARMIPDAFYIDVENKTVVCYEVEDYHPLNPFSVSAYAAAWFNLEYIYWDLHLIAYDIYGHPREIVFPEAGCIAELECRRRQSLAK